MSAIIDSSAIHAIFNRPRPDGAYEGRTLEYLRSVGKLRPILLLAFAPKAAGTYFRQAAIFTIRGQLVRTVHAQGGRDGELYLPNVLTCYLDPDAPATVTHVHMQALPANRHLIDAFGLKPVIMMRNIPDMLASYWDMLETDSVARADGLNCLISDKFLDLSKQKKANFMIEIIAPWYASYFATWKTFIDEAPETVRVLHYDEFRADPADTLQMALAHAGFSSSLQNCEASLQRVWAERNSYRYNRGVQGRGREYFSRSHFDTLDRMLSYYPQLDEWADELMG